MGNIQTCKRNIIHFIFKYDRIICAIRQISASGTIILLNLTLYTIELFLWISRQSGRRTEINLLNQIEWNR